MNINNNFNRKLLSLGQSHTDKGVILKSKIIQIITFTMTMNQLKKKNQKQYNLIIRMVVRIF